MDRAHEAVEPYYDHAGIQIFCADCRDVLPRLSRADLLLTDPPYGEVNRHSGGLRRLDKGDADMVTVPSEELLGLTLRLADSFYIFCGTEQVSALRFSMVAAGLSTRLCLWEKTNPSPMNGEHLWLSAVEACVFGKRPGAFFGEFCASPVWRGPTRSETDHPTEKPLWLFSRLIKASSAEGDTVLDPFMGSGTALLAAKMLGRRAIGVEIEERWCELAARRLAQDLLPFAESRLPERPIKPVQQTFAFEDVA